MKFRNKPRIIEAVQWFQVSEYVEGQKRDVDYYRHPMIVTKNLITSEKVKLKMNKKPDINYEKVNHPSHYNTGNIEVIEDWALDFHLGNAVKYITRAGKKDPSKTMEDLEKAVWYVNLKINALRNEGFGIE